MGTKVVADLFPELGLESRQRKKTWRAEYDYVIRVLALLVAEVFHSIALQAYQKVVPKCTTVPTEQYFSHLLTDPLFYERAAEVIISAGYPATSALQEAHSPARRK